MVYRLALVVEWDLADVVMAEDGNLECMGRFGSIIQILIIGITLSVDDNRYAVEKITLFN